MHLKVDKETVLFFKHQEECSKLKVWHNRMHILRVLTIWLRNI